MENGQYYYCKTIDNREWIYIYKNGNDYTGDYAALDITNNRIFFLGCIRIADDSDITFVRLANQEEEMLLDNKLSEQGKWFNKETNTIENLPSFEFYLDQKITIWKRTNFEISAKTQKEADALAIQMYEKGELDELPWATIENTEEFLTTEENDGCSTAELFQKCDFNYFDNTDYCIYRNGE